MKYRKVTFIYLEEFITNRENLTKEKLKRIFNNKYYNYIMRREKYFFNTNDKEYRSLEKNDKIMKLLIINIDSFFI